VEKEVICVINSEISGPEEVLAVVNAVHGTGVGLLVEATEWFHVRTAAQNMRSARVGARIFRVVDVRSIWVIWGDEKDR
jgi:hypothetical protein